MRTPLSDQAVDVLLHPKGSGVLLALGACAVLFSGCSGSEARSPAAAINGLYAVLVDAKVTGAPTAEQLEAMSPFLSTELRELLHSARTRLDVEAAAHPDEKPAFAEGDLFSSLFEGPSRVVVLASPAGEASRRIPVRFTYNGSSPPVTWTDTVVVADEGGRLVVADVIYAGDWAFANHGGLLETLRSVLQPATSAAWTLRLDGIGPVRVGMTIAEVERVLGATARIDRIEPDDACGYAYLSTVPTGLSLMLSGDTVVRANVDTAGFLDEAGLGVGSTEAEVLARRAGTVTVEPHAYTGPEGHYLIVDDPARPGFRLIFETDGQRVLSMRAGRRPEAELVEGCA